MNEKQLRTLLKKRRLSKHQIAEQTGASVRTVEGWLAGRPMSKPAQKIVEGLKREKQAA